MYYMYCGANPYGPNASPAEVMSHKLACMDSDARARFPKPLPDHCPLEYVQLVMDCTASCRQSRCGQMRGIPGSMRGGDPVQPGGLLRPGPVGWEGMTAVASGRASSVCASPVPQAKRPAGGAQAGNNAPRAAGLEWCRRPEHACNGASGPEAHQSAARCRQLFRQLL